MSAESQYVFWLREALVEACNDPKDPRSASLAETVLPRVDAICVVTPSWPKLVSLDGCMPQPIAIPADTREYVDFGHYGTGKTIPLWHEQGGCGKTMYAMKATRSYGRDEPMHFDLESRLELHRMVWLAYQRSSPLSTEWLQWLEEQERSPRTTKASCIGARRVDDEFRDRVIEHWEGRCAITGLAVKECLEASHIKPWARSTDEERVDVFNGLPLVPNLHKLFDLGLITLNDDGTVIVSEGLSAREREVLGVDAPLRADGLKDAHRRYLPWQREVFEARKKQTSKRPPWMEHHSTARACMAR